MEDYQQRVFEEAESLWYKIKKLNIFIETDTFKALEREDRDLLLLQLYSMQDYFRTLQKRLARFKPEPVLSQDEVFSMACWAKLGYYYTDLDHVKKFRIEPHIGNECKQKMLDFYAAIEKKILDKLGR